MTMPEQDKAPQPGSRIAALQLMLASASKAAVAAKATITDDDRKEIELRRAIAEQEEERSAAELQRRELDLSRRFDEAKEAFPAAHMTSLIIDGYPDSFVIKHSPRAYQTWQAMVAKSAQNKKIDRDKVTRDYAVHSVIDWNGKDLSEVTSPFGAELVVYLTTNPGIVTSIGNAAAGLAGAFSEARKS